MVAGRRQQGTPNQAANVGAGAGADACVTPSELNTRLDRAARRSAALVYHGRMLRDPNLIPLSRQHQHALALCVRLDRAMQAGRIDVEAWQVEIQQQFEGEIGIHFAAEEKELFPAAARFLELKPLVAELLAEHILLRDYFARAAARSLDRQSLGTFGEKLVQHIRKEERQLFEGMQRVVSSQELAAIGSALDEVLKSASRACALPNDATRLQAKP
jgi:hemerythrin-like domain-containing protein